MRILPIIALSLFFCISSSFGFVTIQISNPGVGGIASNFGGQTGGGKIGMSYGVIVSTNDSTFYAGEYDAMTADLYNNGGFLYRNGQITDDYFFKSTLLTSDSTEDLEGDFSTSGGPGTIDFIANVPVAPDPANHPISSGDRFGVIWFDTNTATVGSYYGFYTNDAFTMPASGTVDRSSPFEGTDSVLNANHQFLAAVPEPSHSILALLGVGALVFRRRR